MWIVFQTIIFYLKGGRPFSKKSKWFYKNYMTRLIYGSLIKIENAKLNIYIYKASELQFINNEIHLPTL